jgi:hypothetical protein
MAAAHEDDAATCRCGHAREAHSHYRPGTDCALCPAGECDRFRPAGGGRGLFRRHHADPPESRD